MEIYIPLRFSLEYSILGGRLAGSLHRPAPGATDLGDSRPKIPPPNRIASPRLAILSIFDSTKITSIRTVIRREFVSDLIPRESANSFSGASRRLLWHYPSAYGDPPPQAIVVEEGEGVASQKRGHFRLPDGS